MVATERIAARGDPRHADRPRVHWPPCKRVTPRLRRGLARGDREGGAVDRLAGGVPDDLPLHPVLHDVLRNIAGAGLLRPFPSPTYSVSGLRSDWQSATRSSAQTAFEWCACQLLA